VQVLLQIDTSRLYGREGKGSKPSTQFKILSRSQVHAQHIINMIGCKISIIGCQIFVSACHDKGLVAAHALQRNLTV
jgi:hypothetical protein